MGHEYKVRVSGVDVDFALDNSDEDTEITCDILIDGNVERKTIWVEVHAKLRNWSYLVSCKDSGVAYIVHYSRMSNLIYEWGG